MTKNEIVSRLEAISSQLDELEEMIEKRISQHQRDLLTDMKNNEKYIKQKLSLLENSFEMKRNCLNKGDLEQLPLAR